MPSGRKSSSWRELRAIEAHNLPGASSQLPAEVVCKSQRAQDADSKREVTQSLQAYPSTRIMVQQVYSFVVMADGEIADKS